MSVPSVSVIMPLFNAAPFVGEAVRSVLDQSFADLELIVVDDGSTDGSGDAVGAFIDPRIRLVRQENQGVSAALNHALTLARGRCIARHDADDVSIPTRLAEQVRHLDEHPRVVILGTWASLINGGALPLDTLHHPHHDGAIRSAMLFNTAFVSSSVMFRADVIAKTGGFDLTGKVFDDYDMWGRIMEHGRAANIQEELVKYRVVATGLSHTTANGRERLMEQRRRNIGSAVPHLPKSLLELAARMGMDHPPATLEELQALKRALLPVVSGWAGSDAERAELGRSLDRQLMSYRTLPHASVFHRALDKARKRWALANA